MIDVYRVQNIPELYKNPMTSCMTAASEAFMAAIQQRLQSGSEAENGKSAPLDEIVGFVCGTLTAAERLTHHSMQHHEKEGHTLCIHSVSAF